MANRKRFEAGQGIVAQDSLHTTFQREIFIQVDPASLDHLDYDEVKERSPSGLYVEIDPEKFLQYLPELEAEIFYLFHVKQKHQKDIALLLDISQPTVSYRYRRTLEKLGFLMVLETIPLRELIEDLEFLKDHEKKILFDLFYYTNQELVGIKHDVRQSTVKWIFVKTNRKLGERERADPEKWGRHYGALLYLGANLGIRVLH